LRPENTLEAFSTAVDLGVSTLELDVGVTRDRVVVVTHDPYINGALCLGPGGTRIGERGPLLRDLPLVEVQAYDCGSLNPDRRRFPEPPRRNVPGARIPTLQEVFDLTRDTGDAEVRLNIEVKSDPTADLTVPLEEFVTAVVQVVTANQAAPRVTIQSFDWRVLELVKRQAPALRTAALLSPRTLRAGDGPSPWLNGASVTGAGRTAVGLLAQVASYVDVFSPFWRHLVRGDRRYLNSTVQEIQAAGLLVIPWTVNDANQIEQLLDLGVDGLISDYPDRVIEALARRGVAVQ
jgi:glycerophosphoryl diester phosphodiesterase